jgi:hypothetical protein
MEEYSSSTSSHSILEECVERCIQNSNRFSNQNDQDKLMEKQIVLSLTMYDHQTSFCFFFILDNDRNKMRERKKENDTRSVDQLKFYRHLSNYSIYGYLLSKKDKEKTQKKKICPIIPSLYNDRIMDILMHSMKK